jgi:hypothetical protein
MTIRSNLLAISFLIATLPAVAAEHMQFLEAEAGRGAPAIGGANCQGGLRYDDGSYEGAVGFANAVTNGAYVMAFDLPSGYRADSVCMCWTRTNFSTGDDVDFDVVFYADDGVGPKGEPGYPGTLLGFVPARAEDVPEFAVDGVAMYSVPIPADLPQPLPSKVFVGALWAPFEQRQFFLCNDATPETPLNEAFNSIDGAEWFTTSDQRPTYRALGTVIFGTVPPPPPAEPVPLSWVGLGIGLGVIGIATAMSARRRKRPGA